MKLKIFWVLIAATTMLYGQKKNESDSDLYSLTSRIDRYIHDVMEVDEIPGVAIAVLQNSEILYKKYFGYSNIEHKVAVSDSTVFRVYSLTKLMTAVTVFQLIGKNRLLLQDSISNYIDDVPETWRSIQIRHLLTHSSGLPEYKDFDSSLSDYDLWKKLSGQPLRFQKGERYEYNQTGFWLLKLIIEKITQKDFEDVVLNNQFSKAARGAFFASNSLVAYPNRTAKYIYDHKLKHYAHSTFAAGERSIAGNGLNVSLNQLVKWSKRLDNGSLLNDLLKSKLLEPFEYKNDEKRFVYGLDAYPINQHWMYGFSGGAVVDFRKFDTGLTIMILTNGFKYRSRIATMMRYIAGTVDDRLHDSGRTIKENIRIDLMQAIDKQHFGDNYQKAKKDYPEISFESTLNVIGYDQILAGDLEKAIKVFLINVEENPYSFNAFDSLGEAYMLLGNKQLALKNYQKSLDLNPENENAVTMIEKLKQKR
ncbi:MAG: serine hydrolase [Bacteroidota bacterium]